MSVPIPQTASMRDLTRSIFAGNAVTRSREDSGSSMIEIALCLPVLLMVALGITSFGVAMNNYLLLNESSSVAARQLAISRGQTLDPCAFTSSAVYAAAPTLTKSNLTFTYTLNGTKYTGTTCSSASMTTGAAGNLVQGSTATVQVSYPCTLMIYNTNYAPNGCKLSAQTTELVQ